MGIDVNVRVSFTPLRVEIVQASVLMGAETPKTVPAKVPAPAEQAPAQNPAQAEQAPAPAASRPKRKPAPLPEAPKAVETPEEAVKKLLQGFGIPAVKEDRTEDQQQMAKAMNRGLKELIQMVTHNGSARSIADLRTDDQKAEFVKLAMLMEYDAATKSFTANPF